MPRPIAVCHPLWSLQVGGLERQLLALFSALPADEFHHILVTRGPSSYRPPLPPNVIHVVEPGGCDHAWANRLAGLLCEHRVEVVHARNLSMLLDVMAAAQRVENVAVAFSFHGLESSRRNGMSLRRRLWRQCILRAEARWAVSRAAAEALADQLAMDSDLFDVLHNGVDTTRFGPATDRFNARRSFGVPEDRLLVACVGTLKPIKGQDVLLEAVERLGTQVRNMTLLFAGRDELNARLQHRASQGMSGADVRFLGPLDDPSPLYHAADMVVLPSRWEGLSNTLLEAMACGKPVIATRVGGNSELIQNGQSGLLVSPGSPDALARAILDLAVDPTRRNCLGREARDYVVARHDLRLTARCYRDRYIQLAGRWFSREIQSRTNETPNTTTPTSVKT